MIYFDVFPVINLIVTVFPGLQRATELPSAPGAQEV